MKWGLAQMLAAMQDTGRQTDRFWGAADVAVHEGARQLLRDRSAAATSFQ